MALTFKNKLTNEAKPVTFSRFVTEHLVENSKYIIYQIEATVPFTSDKIYYIGFTGNSIGQRVGEHWRDARRKKIYQLLNEYAVDVDVKILAVANDEFDARTIERQNIQKAAGKYHCRNLINEQQTKVY